MLGAQARILQYTVRSQASSQCIFRCFRHGVQVSYPRSTSWAMHWCRPQMAESVLCQHLRFKTQHCLTRHRPCCTGVGVRIPRRLRRDAGRAPVLLPAPWQLRHACIPAGSRLQGRTRSMATCCAPRLLLLDKESRVWRVYWCSAPARPCSCASGDRFEALLIYSEVCTVLLKAGKVLGLKVLGLFLVQLAGTFLLIAESPNDRAYNKCL